MQFRMQPFKLPNISGTGSSISLSMTLTLEGFKDTIIIGGLFAPVSSATLFGLTLDEQSQQSILGENRIIAGVCVAVDELNQ